MSLLRAKIGAEAVCPKLVLAQRVRHGYFRSHVLYFRMRSSLVPRPHPKGLVTFLVVLCQQNARDYIQYSTSYAICVPCGCHMTADTAQPRKRSNVTRPFPFCGWGLGMRLYAKELECTTASYLVSAPDPFLQCACAKGGWGAEERVWRHGLTYLATGVSNVHHGCFNYRLRVA